MARRVYRDETPLHMKLGCKHHQERDRIRAHLIRRGHDPKALPFEFLVTKIQQRIHKYDLTFAQRQERARANGEKWVTPLPKPPLPMLTAEEWRFLAEHFEGANHPLAQSIYTKATANGL